MFCLLGLPAEARFLLAFPLLAQLPRSQGDPTAPMLPQLRFERRVKAESLAELVSGTCLVQVTTHGEHGRAHLYPRFSRVGRGHPQRMGVGCEWGSGSYPSRSVNLGGLGLGSQLPSPPGFCLLDRSPAFPWPSVHLSLPTCRPPSDRHPRGRPGRKTAEDFWRSLGEVHLRLVGRQTFSKYRISETAQ